MKRIANPLIVFMFLSALLVSCGVNEQRVDIVGAAQGTYYKITYYSAAPVVKQYEIDSLLAEYDMSMSIYEANSLVSRINSGDTTVVIDRFLRDNLIISQKMYEESNGAFDVTGSPLFDYWGFGTSQRDSLLMSSDDSHKNDVDALLKKVGFNKVLFDTVSNKLSFAVPEMQLSFNAVAQGYSVGLVSEMLETRGVKSYIVDIGGEIYAKGTKPDGSNWRVGIELPAATKDSRQQLAEVFEVTDKAVVSSGNYRKYYEVDGKRYSHTIDPRTGFPVANEVFSATVIHNSPAYADAWATVFMVVGLEKTKEILSNHPEMTAYIIYSHEGKFETFSNVE